LERLMRVLDAVLVIRAVGGKQLYDLIGAVGDHVANRTRREVDVLADLKLVFLQRSSPGPRTIRNLLFSSSVLPNAANIAVKLPHCLENSVFCSGCRVHSYRMKFQPDSIAYRGVLN